MNNAHDSIPQGETNAGNTGGLHPLLERFLDARSIEDRLRILSALYPELTDQMIDLMAAALDLEVGPGDLEQRYAELKSCLLMKEKYEKSRYGL